LTKMVYFFLRTTDISVLPIFNFQRTG